MTQWVGAAWRKYCAKYGKSHEKICKRSGLLVALDDNDIDEIRLEGVPTYRPSPTVKLDEHDRAYFKDLIKSHVLPAPVDVVLFCLYNSVYCNCNSLRNVFMFVRVCISCFELG